MRTGANVRRSHAQEKLVLKLARSLQLRVRQDRVLGKDTGKGETMRTGVKVRMIQCKNARDTSFS